MNVADKFYVLCVIIVFGGGAYVLIKGDRTIRVQFIITVLAGLILLGAVKFKGWL